jgi:hypothetical protein
MKNRIFFRDLILGLSRYAELFRMEQTEDIGRRLDEIERRLDQAEHREVKHAEFRETS